MVLVNVIIGLKISQVLLKDANAENTTILHQGLSSPFTLSVTSAVYKEIQELQSSSSRLMDGWIDEHSPTCL